MSKTEFQVRHYRDSDETRVIELLRSTFRDGPAGDWSSAFLRWKHMASPFGPSFMLVAESGGKVIGLRALMRWRFVAGDRTISAVQAVDTVTHPDFQGIGVFSTLTRFALHQLRDQVDLVFNTPNEKSLPGYLKMGWQSVGSLPVSVRVRRPLRFIRGVVRGDREQTVRPAPSVAAELAREALGASADLSELLSDLNVSELGITTARSVEYLRWRYVEVPNLEYFAVTDRFGSKLRGMAIFRVRQRRGLWETALVELLVRRGDRTTARRLVCRMLACADTDHAICYFRRGSLEARVTLRSGFLRSRSGVTLVVNPLRTDLHPLPESPGSWALSLGDVELF